MEEIKGIIEAIEKVKNGGDITKNLRNDIRSKLFVKILEELKKGDEKWKGIDNVIDKLKDKKIHSESGFEIKDLEYNDIISNQISLPQFSKKSTGKAVIDYLGFRIFPDRDNKKKYVNFGICIPLEKEKKLLIGVFAAYRGKKGLNKKFNDKSDDYGLLEELPLSELKEKEDIIGEIFKIFSDKMKKVVEDKKIESKKLNALIDIIWKRNEGDVENVANGQESQKPDSKNTQLFSILNALSTKPFLILAGISGTGKTQIARIIASVVSNPSGKKPEEYINESLILKKEKVAEEKDAKEKDAETGVAFLPVRPDWNEPRKMWGYYNPLTGLFYPTDGLIVLLNAYRDFVMNKSKSKYFIILDEMNLARVEYYMSDLLSLMENMWKRDGEKIMAGETAMIHPLSRCVFSKLPTKQEIDKLKDAKDKYTKTEGEEIEWKIEGEKLCREDCSGCPYEALRSEKKSGDKAKENLIAIIDAFRPIPPRIAYPENLTIIGTVNVDETTFSFSPKVLDRAFVVELNEVYVKKYCDEYGIKSDKFKDFVEKLNEILKPATLHFGYRVIHEMWEYLEKKNEKDNPSDESLDFLLRSKVLPKIHGTEERVGDVLEKLMAYCITGNSGDAEKLKKVSRWWEEVTLDNIVKKMQGEKAEGRKEENKGGAENKQNSVKIRFKDSAGKILDVYRRLKATGYCSYF